MQSVFKERFSLPTYLSNLATRTVFFLNDNPVEGEGGWEIKRHEGCKSGMYR